MHLIEGYNSKGWFNARLQQQIKFLLFKIPPLKDDPVSFFFFFFYVCLTFVVLTSLLTHSVAAWLWPRYPPQTFTKLSTAGSCDNNLSTGGCWVVVVVVVVRLFKCHTKQQVSGVAAGTARVSSGRTAWCSPSQPEGCEERAESLNRLHRRGAAASHVYVSAVESTQQHCVESINEEDTFPLLA